MDYIKNRITGFSIYLFFFMFLMLLGCVLCIVKGILKFNENLSDFLVLSLFIFLFICDLKFLKDIRYIIIKESKLKYWSLFVPWGKTLYSDNYIGKIIISETGIGGSYKVVYLVDKNRKTAFKIMGLHYKNFDEMNNAIPLKKISFSPSAGQYFKLLFFERITIPDKKAKTQTKSKSPGHRIATVFAVISAIGVALFVLGMLVKILSKLL
jgi:hypothetical protein